MISHDREFLDAVTQVTVHVDNAKLVRYGGNYSKFEDMRAEQLLGHDFATAQALGLSHDWAAKAIAATGNYGEIFARDIGEPYHVERGLNALWTQGGLMTPPPMK